MDYDALPGGDLIRKGLKDLETGQETLESLLVSIGATRLRQAGVPVPDHVFRDADRRLYDLLAKDGEDEAHGRYNALVRRLVSFESTLECVGTSTSN